MLLGQHIIFKRLIRNASYFRKIFTIHLYSSDSGSKENVKLLCKHFKIKENKAEFLLMKSPVLKKLTDDEIKDSISTLYEMGISRNELLKVPSLSSVAPITLKYRYAVLDECGVTNITAERLLSYLRLVKQTKIEHLKKSFIIPNTTNIENKLASYMTQWPTSLTTLIYGDINQLTLYSLRLKIIQRYLELMLDLTQDEFNRGLHTYPTIKHRPLKTINETLNILQNVMDMPAQKIKSNMFLVHSNPDNLNNILYNVRSIGGIDMKEILRMHPKLAMVNFATMLETRKLLEEYGINEEAQIRCFQIYTLSPATIKDRLEKAKTIPEFNTYYNHPRFLKMIYYNKTAQARLLKLYSHNKKCSSLNILSGSSAHYDVYEKAPGDRLGKGKDLVFCIKESLGKSYSSVDVHNMIKRHPFWINIPLVQVKYVYEQLRKEFSNKDIYENCPILLYPWNKIRDVLNSLNKKNNTSYPILSFDQIKLISSSQKLSIVLYILEKKHYFSGNGVWSEEKPKNIVDLPLTDEALHLESNMNK